MSLNTNTIQPVQQVPGSQASPGVTAQNAVASTQSTVDMSVKVDDAKAQLHRRKTDMDRYFQDQSITSTEIEILGTEKEQLLKVLQKLDPQAAIKNWTIEDFQKAVRSTKREWESKDRLFNGKPQKFFHKIMGKFGAHANLFKMIPQQTNYTSIVTGAATILVAASTAHVDTIEELSRVLSIIDDHAAACTRDNEFYQSEFMQRAVAKFFIAVFLLLGDVAMWYQSSSWKKMRNSLHEGFKQQFEDALLNVIRLSGDVQRAAEQGAHAEQRATRLTVEELRIELQDFRIGQTDAYRDLMQQLLAQQKISDEQNKLEHAETRSMIKGSMSQLMKSKTFWREIAASSMPLLQNLFINSTYAQQSQMAIAYHTSFPDPNTGPLANLVAPGILPNPSTTSEPAGVRINDLVEWAVPLLDYVKRGAAFQTLSDRETPVFFDHRVIVALDGWLQADSSKLLYLESPSYITAAAMRVVLSAGGLDPPIPCASFFCNATEFDFEDEDSEPQMNEVDPLIGLVYSLIYQILRVLPPLTEQTILTNQTRFAGLGGTMASWDPALDLLEDVLDLAPLLLVIVIDGLLTFEDEHEPAMKDLLDVFRMHMKKVGKVLKILLTTDRMLFSVSVDLEVDEMQILDGHIQGTLPFAPRDEAWDDSVDEYD